MKEKWKPVADPQFAPFYEISNHGRVRARKSRTWGSGRHLSTPKHFVYKGTVEFYGRVVVTLSVSGSRKRFHVHRLVAEAFIPNPSDKPCVNHKDGNPQNNRVSNLEWCTHAENSAHASDLGLVARGDRNPNSKLTEPLVRELRATYKGRRGELKAWAERVGCSKVALMAALNRKTWKHVE